MQYQVVLPVFEGPLDLLLHLIRIHELDIYNIPVAFITGQYLDYLKKAEEIDLDLSGEFIVIAGDLLAIKARTLLPARESDSDGQDGDEPDPLGELVRKLLDYRLYKENADILRQMETSRTRIYFREIDERRLLALFPRPNPIQGLGTDDLMSSFQDILRLMRARTQVVTVHKEAISVRDKISYIVELLGEQPGGLRFARLWERCDDILEALTTFLALLELISKGVVWVRQKELFGEIFVGAARHLPDRVI